MKLQPQKVLIIGSSNTDMVVRTSQFPQPGETVLGGEFIMTGGGKGANQAVAAARLGAKLNFVTKIGKDVFGSFTLASLRQEGIDTSTVIKTGKYPSGVALINVNDDGENTIVVASGANMELMPRDIKEDLYKNAAFILIQLEIPLATVEQIVVTAKHFNTKVVLNPAPATPLSAAVLDGLYLITPNEIEAEMLAGVYPGSLPAMKKVGKYFIDNGVQNVVITLGAKGVFLMTAHSSGILPSPTVTAVDSTAAGDVFNGALVTFLAEGMELREACEFACKAASISVTRRGAQASAPYRKEL
jgi:ribokinase